MAAASSLMGNKSIGTMAISGIAQKTTHVASPDRKAVFGPLPYLGRRRAYNQTSRIPIKKLAGMKVAQPVGVFPSARNAAVQASSKYTRWPPYSNALTTRPAANPPHTTRPQLIEATAGPEFVFMNVPLVAPHKPTPWCRVPHSRKSNGGGSRWRDSLGFQRQVRSLVLQKVGVELGTRKQSTSARSLGLWPGASRDPKPPFWH